MLFQNTGKMKLVDDSDSDEDMDVDVLKLQKRVIVLEQDSILKDAQITSLHDQLEYTFGREFADTNDDLTNVERRHKTAKEKTAEDVEREAALNIYLETTQAKKRKFPPKKASNRKMLIMKNQDLNPLDENFQPKDPTKTSDIYVIELGKSHYDKVGNK
ncbi:hypothetical protein Hanom_Chr03g00202851 [Helianthus anomalus]